MLLSMVEYDFISGPRDAYLRVRVSPFTLGRCTRACDPRATRPSTRTLLTTSRDRPRRCQPRVEFRLAATSDLAGPTICWISRTAD